MYEEEEGDVDADIVRGADRRVKSVSWLFEEGIITCELLGMPIMGVADALRVSQPEPEGVGVGNDPNNAFMPLLLKSMAWLVLCDGADVVQVVGLPTRCPPKSIFTSDSIDAGYEDILLLNAPLRRLRSLVLSSTVDRVWADWKVSFHMA